jgi:predicted nucleotidyltransferase
MNLYKNLFSKLNQAKIKYLVVGGVAVNLHGFRRFTGDLDILVLINPENLKRLELLCKDIGYFPRQPIEIASLLNENNLKNLITEKNFKAFTLVPTKSEFDLDIDILTNESLQFDKYKKNCETINVWDLDLPVIHIDDLIEMKSNTGRQKDLEDLKALLQIKNGNYGK